MLSYRPIILALLAIGATSILAQPADRPYAPELYDRQALEDASRHVKRSEPSIVDRPYSPDLYFRRALTTDEMEQDSRRSTTGQPTKTLGKRSLCRRDAECGSGFCGSHGACLEKRSAGSTCKDATNACSDGHFCSTVNFRCQQKRSLGGACRSDDGCSPGLECLNFKCFEAAIKNGAQEFKDKVKSFKDPESPSPSGSHKFPIPFRKRTILAPGNGDDGDDDPYSHLPQEIKDKLKNLPHDLENLPKEIKDHLNSWLAPKPSGSPGDKKVLKWTH